MNKNFDELKDWKDGVRRMLEQEMERLKERYEQINNDLKALEATEELVAELEKVLAENEALRQQLQEEKDKNQVLEMRFSEMSKLSAGVAKKSSQEELMTALSIFVNKSKQKRIEKRMAVKEMVLELANANGIVFPKDLAATLDSLDDEQPDPKVVNVSGSYNDIHDNAHVDLNDKQKSDHGRK